MSALLAHMASHIVAIAAGSSENPESVIAAGLLMTRPLRDATVWVLSYDMRQ